MPEIPRVQRNAAVIFCCFEVFSGRSEPHSRFPGGRWMYAVFPGGEKLPERAKSEHYQVQALDFLSIDLALAFMYLIAAKEEVDDQDARHLSLSIARDALATVWEFQAQIHDQEIKMTLHSMAHDLEAMLETRGFDACCSAESKTGQHPMRGAAGESIATQPAAFRK